MKKSNIPLMIALVVCLAVTVVFGVPNIIRYSDKTFGDLTMGTVPRLAVGIFLVLLTASRTKGVFTPKWNGKHLLWSIPCFSVAIVNFPFTALIGGAAAIERADLLWLFILKCAAIALLEEVFFRAILLPLFLEYFAKKRNRILLSTLTASVIFSLTHLINLFFGADFGAVALQLGYTFLLGCMLCIMLIHTKNIWLCISVHFIFDIGGTIVTDLGSGAFQDMTFWILTAIVGAVCTVYMILSLIKINGEDTGSPFVFR